jgi:hypothetical protein
MGPAPYCSTLSVDCECERLHLHHLNPNVSRPRRRLARSQPYETDCHPVVVRSGFSCRSCPGVRLRRYVTRVASNQEHEKLLERETLRTHRRIKAKVRSFDQRTFKGAQLRMPGGQRPSSSLFSTSRSLLSGRVVLSLETAA